METFKIGDEVEVTVTRNWYSKGARGEIVKESMAGWWVHFTSGEFEHNKNDAWSVLEEEMRHVQPAPTAPAVTSRAVVLSVEGVEYTAMFTIVNDRTGCALYWRNNNHEYAFAGGTKRNPKDAQDEAIGMRVAMRRACGIGNPHAHQLPAVYRAFRKWQYIEAHP